MTFLAKKEQALKTLTIVIDTREKETARKNARRADFERLGASVIDKALNFGDYAARFTDPSTGETVDLGREVVFERKKDIEELVRCLTTYRERFFAELQRATEAGAHLIIAVESGSVSNLMNGKYNADVLACSMAGTLFAILNRYNVEVVWLTPETFAAYVYGVYRRMILDRVE